MCLTPMHLPQAPLPNFDGKYEHWFKVKALFVGIMIGDAAGAIDQQTINNNNYDGAWTLLAEGYENLQTIVDIYINGLLNQNACARDLNQAVTTCVRHVDALKFHGKDRYVGNSNC